MSNKIIKRKKSKLIAYISLIVLCCLVVMMMVFYGLYDLLFIKNILGYNERTLFAVIILLIVMSMGIGVVISFVLGKILAHPINSLNRATFEVAKGNFDVKLRPSKNETLNEIVQNFNNMTQELKSVETLKVDFISNISHEIKTPISIISLYTNELKNDKLDPITRKHYEEVVDSNIKRITELTGSILQLSKLKNENIAIKLNRYSLDEQIRQCILALEPKWSEKNIDFDLDLPTTRIEAPEDLLVLVWQNLIDNAIKFSPQGSTVSVKIYAKGNAIKVMIADNGIGISEDALNHIFDKFYRVEDGNAQGNGLGLPIVKQVLDNIGGTITCTSKPNEGTTFEVTLMK